MELISIYIVNCNLVRPTLLIVNHDPYFLVLVFPIYSVSIFLRNVMQNGYPSLIYNFMADEMVGSSDEDQCSGETDMLDIGQEQSSRLADHELKEMLLKKYSGCLSRLRSEFLKKRKKGKLPKDARSALLEWWNTHYRWPYPTVI